MSQNNNFPNLFLQMGYTQEAIDNRLEEIYQTIFHGSEEERIYHEAGDDMGYIEDTGNHDVRTEGMSYGMMVSVQLNHKDEFDRIWKWARTYMCMDDPYGKNYFAWSCNLDGSRNSDGPAPDGEEFFAMALFLAKERWGNGQGIFNYEKEANAILEECIHKGEPDHPGQPMWEPDNHLIKFITNCDWSDPSYHLPHFYEMFAEYGDPKNADFWREAAAASRNYLHKACHPKTGLSAEYADYDGTPHLGDREIFGRHDWYYSDAYRTIANLSLDYVWFHKDPWQVYNARRFQTFYCTVAKECWDGVFTIDGQKVQDVTALHPTAIIAVNAAASLAALDVMANVPSSQIPEDVFNHAQFCLRKFLNTPLRKGPRRYYDNFLYIFAFMALSGNYRNR